MLLGSFSVANAQVEKHVYSYPHYQKYSERLYSPDTRLHTAAKPFPLGNALTGADSPQNRENTESWLVRKIFREHLLEVNSNDHAFFLDLLPDFVFGKEVADVKKRNIWLNTRGFQVGLAIGGKFSFYADAFENQAVFPNYLSDYVDGSGVVPGQGTAKILSDNKKDWMYSTASLSYAFSDHFRTTLAYGKNHIGDGYRSLLLSDFSSNYTHLKLIGTIGNVQYTSIWAYMTDPKNPRTDAAGSGGRFGDGIKWGAFQYLDYNASNRLSLGFFQSVVWANRNPAGHRGFDFNYIHPAIFLRPVESNNSTSPDKMFLGLNAKYKILRNVSAYGQFLLGEFTAREFFGGRGYAHNKWGIQAGLRGFDAFSVKNLNLLAEYNAVRPYTYQHFAAMSNYSNHAEPLAHPRGANFRELLGLANYAWRRFDFAAKGVYSRYGTDPADGANMGGNIFQSYNDIPNMHGNFIGQGVRNDLFYADATAAYVLNPKYNLRFEVGYAQRYNKVENAGTEKSGVFSLGLRSTFRDFYRDF